MGLLKRSQRWPLALKLLALLGNCGSFFSGCVRLRASDLASRHPALYCRCFDAVAVAGMAAPPLALTGAQPGTGQRAWLYGLVQKFHTPPFLGRSRTVIWAFGRLLHLLPPIDKWAGTAVGGH